MCEAEAGTASQRKRVLIVDDEQSILVLLDRLLRAENDVVAVDSAIEAKQRLAEEHFDVVLCDIMMPGMSGLELHSALCCEAPDLARRIVFCTAGGDTAKLRDYVAISGNMILWKPFRVAQVRSVVRSFL